MKSKQSKQSNYKYGVMICTPLDQFWVPRSFPIALLGLYTNEEIYRRLSFNDEFPIDHCRNKMVEEALSDSKITHVWFLDSDITPPRDAMVHLLGMDKDIAGLLCFSRRLPDIYPIIYEEHPKNRSLQRYVVEYKPGIKQYDATGTGCLMVKRKVFEKVPKPWFKLEEYNGNPVGEDIYFCKKARKHGFKVWVDTAKTCRHATIIDIDERHYAIKRDVYIKAQREKGMIR